MNIWFIAAGCSALITALMHFVLGGRLLVAPLLKANDLHDVPKHTHYYCWHIVSIVLFSMSACFFYCAFYAAPELAVLQTAFAGLFCGWSVMLIVWKKQDPRKLIQWALFLPTFVFALVAL